MNNPWLSEFERFPWFGRQIQREWPLAAVFMVIASFSLLLGNIAGVNCLSAKIIFIDGITGAESQAASLTFGFLGELNHGIFYLVGVPVLIFLSLRFLTQSYNSISSLANMQQIRIDGEIENSSKAVVTGPDSEISRRNARVFVPIVMISVLLSFSIIFGTELPSQSKRVFGWVQGENYRKLHDAKLNSLDGGPIPAAEAFALDKIGKGGVNEVSQLPPKDYQALRGQLVIRLPRELNAGPTKQNSPSRIAFSSFLYTALATESLAIAFLIWISLKAIFVAWFLISARWEGRFRGQALPIYKPLLCRSREALFPKALSARISFILNDGKRARYGLQDFDPMYNLFLIIGVTGSVVYLLGRVSNFSKGTSWISSQGSDFVGQLLIALLVSLPILAILFFPVMGIAAITYRAKKQVLLIIEQEIGQAVLSLNDERRKQLTEEKEEIRNNSVWPLRGKKNITVASTCLTLFMLAVPLRTIGEFINSNDNPIAKQVQTIGEKAPRLICRQP